MLPSSLENSILNAIRRSSVGYADALAVIRDSRLTDPPKKRRIRANTPRGRLLQRLFSLGPCRLVPDPHEDGWIYKGGGYRGTNSYADRLEAYADQAEIVLERMVRIQTALIADLSTPSTTQLLDRK